MKMTPCKIGIEIEGQFPVRDASEESWSDDHPECPNGWIDHEDGGGQWEFTFDGPADTLKEAFTLLDRMGPFLKKHKFTAFNNCGTHIHLGMKEFLQERYKTQELVDYNWAESRVANIYHIYFVQRITTLYDLVPAWRKTSTWCEVPYQAQHNYPLWRIHNKAIVEGGFYTSVNYSAVEKERNWPTFEFRQFPGTANTDAVKGYLCLLINMLKRAERLITKEVVANDTPLVEMRDFEVPTKKIFVNGPSFTISHLKAEVCETDCMSEPLIKWIDSTVRNKGEPTGFTGTLPTRSTQAVPLRAAA